MAGSWYHMSKCNDINNIYLAKRTFGINVSDFRTAIVYGLNYDLYDKKTRDYSIPDLIMIIILVSF